METLTGILPYLSLIANIAIMVIYFSNKKRIKVLESQVVNYNSLLEVKDNENRKLNDQLTGARNTGKHLEQSLSKIRANREKDIENLHIANTKIKELENRKEAKNV